MLKFNLFGRGLGLRMAIMFACQMAFILFGILHPHTTHMYTCLTGIGYDQGVFSGIVGNEDFLGVVHHPSAGILGIIVSIYNLGCFSGTIVSFAFSDKLGPRLSMWIAMAWVIVRRPSPPSVSLVSRHSPRLQDGTDARQVGAILQTTSFSRAQLLVARFVTGIGTGIETTTVPAYQSELCEARKRGRYVCSEALFVGVGIVIAYWFDYGMSYVNGSVNWRLPVACQMVFALFVVVLVFGYVSWIRAVLPPPPLDYHLHR